MQLHDLRETIIQSNDDFWEVLDVGPYFHDRIYVDGDLEFNGTSHSHYNRAVFSADIAIALEWGMDASGHEDETHLWETDAHFPDSKVTSEFVDVFYQGSLVDRARIFVVDGGRAYLPNYKTTRTDGGDPTEFDGATWSFTSTRWNFYLAQLINQLANNRDFARYAKQAGINVE